ncbi:4a-hydroxytetrahydrobiopterin dehydratase [Herbaspirillum sp. RTI4]|uniref:4a-hydroxytetrahydrobiopterin dehydratase n=1 Tax=Herbaspirillum sp. RTI4 TaxID=3048640 RepID=UPI002AB38BD5|nr:4a-hydroxytetrahydrobiopterin dehydratase [Herbaspirillum sp. RTI4]MDY7578189.1 4a-hydroxytetrahydrobiopterin dehydratase [Herbaspirillum sp. RTI4]MEA9981527.1 4a-hydroxytetrahydrobiopterin dehydratase [Herbaspirillum sp. RTI4]
MSNSSDLMAQQCQPQADALSAQQVLHYLSAVEGWEQDGQHIVKTFSFQNYYETLAFINAIAYVVHAQDHHPELIVTYNRCVIRFDTHSVNEGKGGLSVNDFICAAKVDAVFDLSFSKRV